MFLNDYPEKLKVGDLVTSEYDYCRKDLVRRITAIEASESYESGYVASASAVYGGSAIESVDAAWFLPAKEGERPADEEELDKWKTLADRAVAALPRLRLYLFSDPDMDVGDIRLIDRIISDYYEMNKKKM